MRKLIVALFVVVCALVLSSAAAAQCPDDSSVTDFKVRKVTVKALWGNVPEQLKTDLAKHQGDSYSSLKGSEYAAEVRNFMSSDPGQANYERLVSGRLKGAFKVVYQHWCAQPVETVECEKVFPGRPGESVQCVDVEIASKIIHVDVIDTGAGVLPVPHSDYFSFLGAVPRQIAALNPGVNANLDQELGPTLGGNLSINLLDLNCVVGNKGSVLGEVSKANGLSAAGAQITLTNKQTGAVLKATADKQGIFSLESVPTGEYTLSALDASGLEHESGDLKVAACNITSLDVKLEHGIAGLGEGQGTTLPDAVDEAEPGQLDVVVRPTSDRTTKGEDGFSLTPKRATRLQLDAGGYKSTKEPFYETRTGLTLMRSVPLGRIKRYTVGVNYLTSNLPHGDGSFLKNSVLVGGSMDIGLRLGPIKLASFGAGYRSSRNRLYAGNNALNEFTSENAFDARLILQGILAKGFTRVAGWSEFNSPGAGRDTYRRFAGAFGYEREFAIPRKEADDFAEIDMDGDGEGDCFYPYKIKQVKKRVDGVEVIEFETESKNEAAIGLEAIAGAGRVRGDAPEYARFYGGNWSAKFLYDELGSEGLATMPNGPLLRSVGAKQAGIITPAGQRGGTSYWHVNVNVSIPIPRLSQPLIPPELVGRSLKRPNEFKEKVDPGDFVCRDLKYVLKKKVDEGKKILIRQQASASLTPEERNALAGIPPPTTPEEIANQKRAQQKYAAAKEKFAPAVNSLWSNDIAPVANYIADRADIYSIKPLLMFDAAYVNGPDNINHQPRYSAGGGIQLNVVIARFEAGYLHTLHRASGDNRGNFIMRLIFRNLF
jgi:carboxypeptidase family protein